MGVTVCTLAFQTAKAEGMKHVFDVPPMSVVDALRIISEKSDYPFLYSPKIVGTITTDGFVCKCTVDEVLAKLLEGHDLEIRRTEYNVILIRRITPPSENGVGNVTNNQKKALLAGAAAAALVLGNQQASAQETTEQAAVEAQDTQRTLDKIVVTGLRQSLAQAVDRKRNSRDIIDSIVSEDIGKFPDANVAESLQRISGVSIDRQGGEGQSVTVRGFGPQFNTVLVNGRRIASDANGRSFNFDLVPADLIGGADVYKSANAALQEGGIGSTINLRLQRPLDIGKFSAVVSGKGVYDKQAEEVAPQLFGFVSNTFLDDKLGVLVSASYQTRKTSNDQVTANNKFTEDFFDEETRKRVFANGVGNPGVDEYVHLTQTNYIRANEDRDRLGLSGVVEFEPTNNLKFTVDGLYTKFEVTGNTVSNMTFNERATFHNAVADENNVILRYDNFGNPFNIFIANNRDSDLYQIGGKVEWDITDNLKATFDVSKSHAQNDAAGGNYYVVVAGEKAILRNDLTSGQPAPIGTSYLFTPSTEDLNGDGVVDQYDYVLGDQIVVPDINKQNSWYSQRSGEGDEDDITEIKGDFAWNVDYGYLRSVTAGAYHGKQEKIHTSARTANPNNVQYLNAQIPLPASFFTVDHRDGFLGAVPGSYPSATLNFNVEEVIEYLERPESQALRDELNGLPPGTTAANFVGGLAAVPDLANGYEVEETITSFFVNTEFGADIGEMELTVNAGLRYTKTEATSGGYAQGFANFRPNTSRPDVLDVTRSVAAPISEETSYNNLLPSINARLRVNENVILRAAYSETLTRPNLSDLNPSIITPFETRLSNMTGTAGNPALKPYIAKSLDFSSEFYFGDSTIFSMGLFNKDIDGFIVRGGAREAITVPEPNDLDLITEDRTNISGNQIFFLIDRPRNLETTSVYGAEFSFQHTFDYLPSFLQYTGINANFTYVKGTDEFDVTRQDNNVVLPGLGDSQNVVLFYDDKRFEARVAYNSRDRFFRNFAGLEPVYTDQYDQIDARIAYNFKDRYQVFVEGTNLTESYSRNTGRSDVRFVSLESPGARFTLGARARF